MPATSKLLGSGALELTSHTCNIKTNVPRDASVNGIIARIELTWV